ncbi:hypothetical protein AB832_03710 [Flavobacteriaceae bacterium (ex Bugula neritina AB1)]|nr:hypothetical protein AB832_03710 [Flavobacteriaceae bacterium (ex Bugula neritina AB1)]
MNLENFKTKELNVDELKRVNGGGFWDQVKDGVVGYAVDTAIEFTLWAISENNETYGRRMMESGSPGGHK